MSGSAVVALRVRVREALPDVEPDSLILVACSGGPDSLALAATAAWVGQRSGWRIGAVIVDHGLQDDSAHIAESAARTCRDLGLDPVDVVRVDVSGEGGPEAAARMARYAALDAALAAHDATALLLGHTRDDQAESVLLGLAQGSGSRSLAGMRERTGHYVRPFLQLSRATVHEAAAELMAGIAEPWQDPHNADPRFARVRVREAMATLDAAIGPGISSALARTAELLRDDADALDAMAEQIRWEADGSIEVSALESLPRALRTRVLRRMAIAAGSESRDLDHGHVTAMERLVSQWSGQGPVALPGRVSAERAHGRIRIHATR